MNKRFAAIIAPFGTIVMSSCGGGPPPAPPTEYCSIPSNCVGFKLASVSQLVCPEPPASGPRNEWYISVTSLPPGKTVDVYFIRHKKFDGGGTAGSETGNALGLTSNSTNSIGCQYGREGGITSPILIYSYEITCVAFSGTACTTTKKSSAPPFSNCTVVSNNGQFRGAFRQLNKIVHKQASYPIDEAVFVGLFTPGSPIQCQRDSVKLESGKVINYGESCKVQFSTSYNMRNFSGELNLPPMVSGFYKTPSLTSTEIDFVSGTAPIASMFENGKLNTDYSGEVDAARLDSQYLWLDISAASGPSCLKYDYLH